MSNLHFTHETDCSEREILALFVKIFAAHNFFTFHVQDSWKIQECLSYKWQVTVHHSDGVSRERGKLTKKLCSHLGKLKGQLLKNP